MARHRKRKPMAEINVVPYIDVMLVLLIIFMVTAPLLHLGVDIELPQSDAAPIQPKAEPLLISVTAGGDYYLNVDGTNELIDAQTLMVKVAAFVRRNPDIPVMVGGDKRVPYGTIYEAMVLLQGAGVPKVGLMSDQAEP